jgi:hypothetical protein
MEEVLNGYITNPNPTPTLTLTLTKNNKINPKRSTLEIDQMTCHGQFDGWKRVKTIKQP